jgi:uncharacterized protein with PIN domain
MESRDYGTVCLLLPRALFQPNTKTTHTHTKEMAEEVITFTRMAIEAKTELVAEERIISGTASRGFFGELCVHPIKLNFRFCFVFVFVCISTFNFFFPSSRCSIKEKRKTDLREG